MNRVLQLLIVSDVVMSSALGLVGPILAVFATSNLVDGGVEVAGFATTIYLLTRSLLQVPLAQYADHHRAQRKFLLAGHLLMALVPFAYLVTTRSWHLYLAEVLNGLGTALAAPLWLSVFSTNLTKGREGYEWSVQSTLFSVGTGIAAGLGGLLVSWAGFQTTFVLAGVLSLLGVVPLLFLKLPEQPTHWLDYARHLPRRRRLKIFTKPPGAEKPGLPE